MWIWSLLQDRVSSGFLPSTYSHQVENMGKAKYIPHFRHVHIALLFNHTSIIFILVSTCSHDMPLSEFPLAAYRTPQHLGNHLPSSAPRSR